MKQQSAAWRVGLWLGLAAVGVCGAAGTNVPPASTNAPAKAMDYRAMLERVRLKQQEHNSLEELQTAVSQFQLRTGRLPGALSELVERGMLAQMPRPPSGARFVYDRTTGSVKLASATVAAPPPRPSLPAGNANLVIPKQ